MGSSISHVVFLILEAALLLLFSLKLIGYDVIKGLKRVLAASILLGLFFYAIFQFPLISVVRLLLSGLACYGLALWFFGFGKIRGLLVSLTLLGIGLAHEIIVLLALSYGFHHPLGNLNNVLEIPAAYLWTGMIPLALATFLVRLMNWRLPQSMIKMGEPGYPLMNKHTIVLLAFSQLLLLSAALIQYLFQSPFPTGSTYKQVIIIISFAASIILNVFITTRMVKVYEKEALLAAREAKTESFTSLAESIKAQNQDFTSHIQQISDFIQKDRLDELPRYLESISGKITALNDVLKVDNPIIGAILKAKATEADVRRIRLEINISTSLAGLGGTALDLARIIGNLIDNAFDAVISLEDSERVVSVEICQAGPLLQLEVSNRGPIIEAESTEHIFESGYTTKGEGHSGLGLHIVKTLTEKLMGTVKVLPDGTKGTQFVVTLPSL